jgi:flagellar biosynthetic protein FlhB
MAGDEDAAQKTEEPSTKKLADAKKKGDSPRSQEVKHWFMLVAGAIGISSFSPWVASSLKNELGSLVANLHAIPMDGLGLLSFLNGLLANIGFLLMPMIILFILAGLLGNILQAQPVFTAEKIKPKLSKISLKTGFKRLFSAQSLVEFLKTLAKFGIVISVTVWLVWPERDILVEMITRPIDEVSLVIYVFTLKIIGGVVGVMTIIAAIDFAFQKAQHTKRLRMSKQEIKDEYKQLEGDPHVKQRIRQIRSDRARTRMMDEVPSSSVIITNPTHYAIAIKYEHGSMEVPKLVAKGVDFLAQKIREVAEENKIPIIENPPLARALYASVELGEEVPTEHYKAVAQVISYLLRLKKGERATYTYTN